MWPKANGFYWEQIFKSDWPIGSLHRNAWSCLKTHKTTPFSCVFVFLLFLTKDEIAYLSVIIFISKITCCVYSNMHPCNLKAWAKSSDDRVRKQSWFCFLCLTKQYAHLQRQRKGAGSARVYETVTGSHINQPATAKSMVLIVTQCAASGEFHHSLSASGNNKILLRDTAPPEPSGYPGVQKRNTHIRT